MNSRYAFREQKTKNNIGINGITGPEREKERGRRKKKEGKGKEEGMRRGSRVIVVMWWVTGGCVVTPSALGLSGR